MALFACYVNVSLASTMQPLKIVQEIFLNFAGSDDDRNIKDKEPNGTKSRGLNVLSKNMLYETAIVYHSQSEYPVKLTVRANVL